METTTLSWGYIGIMEKTMETTVANFGYIGIMERNGGYYSGSRNLADQSLQAGCHFGSSKLNRLKQGPGLS